jgi:hypothetical protein
VRDAESRIPFDRLNQREFSIMRKKSTFSMKAPLFAVAVSLCVGCSTWDRLTGTEGSDVSVADADGRTRKPSGPELPEEPPPEINLGADPATPSPRASSSAQELATTIRHEQVAVSRSLTSAPPSGDNSPGRMRNIGALGVLGGGEKNPFYRVQVLEEDGSPALDANGKPVYEYPFFLAFQRLSRQPLSDFRDVWSMSIEDAAEDIHHLGDVDDQGRPMVELVKATIPVDLVPPELRESNGVYGADTWWIIPLSPWQLEQMSEGNFQRLSLVDSRGVHLPITRATGREGSRFVFMNEIDAVLGVDIFNPDGVAAGDASRSTEGPWNIGVFDQNAKIEFRGVKPSDEETSE